MSKLPSRLLGCSADAGTLESTHQASPLKDAPTGRHLVLGLREGKMLTSVWTWSRAIPPATKAQVCSKAKPNPILFTTII